MRRRPLELSLAILVLTLAGCGNPIRHGVEKSVEQSLLDIIGPAKSYSVRAYGPTSRLIGGKLDGLDITGADVKLSGGLTVSRLFVRIRDLEVDTQTKRIQRVGSAQYQATLTEAELNRYLRERYPDVPDLKARLRNNYLTVSTRPGIAGLRATIEADAKLDIRRRRILALDLEDVRAAGISAPGFARDFINDRLPVIFDAGDLGFDANIDRVVVQPSQLSVSGNLDLLQASRSRQAD